jgi:hypothetical protein
LRSPRDRLRLLPPAWPAAVFENQSLELVDRDQLSAPRHLDQLDQGQHAPSERRWAYSECGSRLRTCVRQPLDTMRRAYRWQWRDALRDDR